MTSTADLHETRMQKVHLQSPTLAFLNRYDGRIIQAASRFLVRGRLGHRA
jgi:hypothetical protein